MARGANIKRITAKKLKEERKNIIAPLLVKCWTYRRIREEVMARLDLETYSLRTVKKDIDEINAERLELRHVDEEKINEMRELELERLDAVISEAWEQWERSKSESIQTVTKQKGKANKNSKPDTSKITPESIEAIRKMNPGIGDPKYLDVILNALNQRRKVMGLDSVNVKMSGNIEQKIEIMHTHTGYTPASSEEEVRKREGITNDGE